MEQTHSSRHWQRLTFVVWWHGDRWLVSRYPNSGQAVAPHKAPITQARVELNLSPLHSTRSALSFTPHLTVQQIYLLVLHLCLSYAPIETYVSPCLPITHLALCTQGLSRLTSFAGPQSRPALQSAAPHVPFLPWLRVESEYRWEGLQGTVGPFWDPSLSVSVGMRGL